MELAPTPRDTIHSEGTAKLYRFRPPRSEPSDRKPQSGTVDRGGKDARSSAPDAAKTPRPAGGLPILLVPSLINRWYVLDLRRGSSLVEALVASGRPTFCLDWGVPEDEDRYLTWDDVIRRLQRAIRMVRRNTGSRAIAMLGYCMGGTLSGIATALDPTSIAAMINLAGPFDFAHAGLLGTMTDARWFDADAIAAAGNINAAQMQSGFLALRPTQNLAKLVGVIDRGHKPEAMEAFMALESWASDNIAFPAAAYTTYIRDLYQDNLLVSGEHHVAGERVDLGNIKCPVLTVVTERDKICPPPAATGLNDRAGGPVRDLITVPGGHVGAVVGSRAKAQLYPAIVDWLARHAAA